MDLSAEEGVGRVRLIGMGLFMVDGVRLGDGDGVPIVACDGINEEIGDGDVYNMVKCCCGVLLQHDCVQCNSTCHIGAILFLNDWVEHNGTCKHFSQFFLYQI